MMRLPDHIFGIIRELHARNLALARGDDEARRALQKQIVETAVARHPDEGWGWKSADAGRPPSKDAIANRKLMPGHLLAWDCFSGGTREPVQGESEIIDGQVFIELAGVDHLAGLPVTTVAAPAAAAPASTAASLPPRDEFLAALTWLNALYRDQLARPGGVDLEGIAAHIFDTYLNARLHGAAVADAKERVVQSINAILGRHDIHA